MTIKFRRHQLPMAYSMIETARRIRPRRDGGHLAQKYFLLWTAFSAIYTAIAHRKGCRTRLRVDKDGAVVTAANGSVVIPQVVEPDEGQRIALACQELPADLQDALIRHPGTAFFAGRVPSWRGIKIEHDAFGQRVNGVIHVSHTTGADYPVWSPVDVVLYASYLKGPDEETREFLARQIVDLLRTIREDLMQGSSRKLDDANDLTVHQNALPMLELIVASYTG
jgi:hypothetical protein